jgi:hypothetical protein
MPNLTRLGLTATPTIPYWFSGLQSYTLLSEQGTYTKTGQDVSFNRDLVLITNYGTYVLSGQDTSLNQSRFLNSDYGIYSLSGQDATLNETNNYTLDAAHNLYQISQLAQTYFVVDRYLTAEQGTFATSGNDAAFVVDRYVQSAYGTYTLSGQLAAFDTAGNINASLGTYELSGQTVFLLVQSLIPADYGNYQLSGQNLTFQENLIWVSAQGNYNLTGNNADLTVLFTYFLNANHGLYLGDYNAQASFDVDRIVPLQAGNYQISGQVLSLTRELGINLETDDYVITGYQVGFGRSGIGAPYYFLMLTRRT